MLARFWIGDPFTISSNDLLFPQKCDRCIRGLSAVNKTFLKLCYSNEIVADVLEREMEKSRKNQQENHVIVLFSCDFKSRDKSYLSSRDLLLGYLLVLGRKFAGFEEMKAAAFPLPTLLSPHEVLEGAEPAFRHLTGALRYLL